MSTLEAMLAEVAKLNTEVKEIFDAANKAFETIKEYNRSLVQQKSQETR